MDAPDRPLEERIRRLRTILAAVARDPALDESLRETTEDAVERLDTALIEGIEDHSTLTHCLIPSQLILLRRKGLGLLMNCSTIIPTDD